MKCLVKAEKCKSNMLRATHTLDKDVVVKVFLFHQPHSLGRDAVGVVREEKAPA